MKYSALIIGLYSIVGCGVSEPEDAQSCECTEVRMVDLVNYLLVFGN